MSIQDAIEHYGSPAELARALGLNRSAVSHWIKLDRIPWLRQCELEVMTGRKLRADPGAREVA